MKIWNCFRNWPKQDTR